METTGKTKALTILLKRTTPKPVRRPTTQEASVTKSLVGKASSMAETIRRDTFSSSPASSLPPVIFFGSPSSRSPSLPLSSCSSSSVVIIGPLLRPTPTVMPLPLKRFMRHEENEDEDNLRKFNLLLPRQAERRTSRIWAEPLLLERFSLLKKAGSTAKGRQMLPLMLPQHGASTKAIPSLYLSRRNVC